MAPTTPRPDGPPTDAELKAARDQQHSNGANENVNEHDEEGRGSPQKNFVASTGLTTAQAEQLLTVHGKNELPEKHTPSWLIFVRQLWGWMPGMIWVAIIVMAAIENWTDMGILLGIQFANATIAWYETSKAASAVAALKASLKPQATVKRDGKFQTINATLVVPGDLVLLGSGSAVPADCLINEGQVEVDQSALTGESLPVTMYRGDSIKMGSTVTRGEVEATVEFTGKNTFFGKTATLIQGVESLGNIQKILMRIMFVLVVLSFVLCFTALFYILFYLHEPFRDSLKFVVVLIVASIPIAMEIVTTTTLALGSRQLSSHGAIVTRLTAIEEMAGMNMLCSDKTGTLTLNKMVIQEDCPVFTPGETAASVLTHAALASKWRDPPRDALDTMVLGAADLAECDKYRQLSYTPFDPTIKRTESSIQAPDGKVFKVTKGAPHVITKLLGPRHEQVVQAVEEKITELGLRGIRALAIARTDDSGEWELLGLLTFLDPPRPDTKRTIERALEYGVDVKMITGDHMLIAKETARVLGMNTNIKDARGLPNLDADGKVPDNLANKYGAMILEADGFAQVYPEHKYLIVETLRQMGFAVGMTGDGVNDAPALKRADVGVAVSGATDAARASADIVLTQPGLSVIVEAIVIAREIFIRIKNFLNYRIACTLEIVLFFFIAVLALHPRDYCLHECTGEGCCYGESYFRLPVIMLMLITLLNDGTLISIGYDHVLPSSMPEKWNLKVLFLIAVVLAAVALGSSLLLLWCALDSGNPSGVFHRWGIYSLDPQARAANAPPIEGKERMPYGQIVTLIFMKVALSDFLTLFSARTHETPFWSVRPGNLLLAGAIISLSISTVLASIWPTGSTDGVPAEGLAHGRYRLWPLWIWIYCIVFWWIQDLAKVVAYWLMHRYDVFHINSGKLVNVRGSDTFTDEKRPHTKAYAGQVESKLLERKVDRALETISRIAEQTHTPQLQRVSKALEIARTSTPLMRPSLRIAGMPSDRPGEIEEGVSRAQEMVQQVERASLEVPAEHRSEIEEAVRDVRTTAEHLNAINIVLRDNTLGKPALDQLELARTSLTRGSPPRPLSRRSSPPGAGAPAGPGQAGPSSMELPPYAP